MALVAVPKPEDTTANLEPVEPPRRRARRKRADGELTPVYRRITLLSICVTITILWFAGIAGLVILDFADRDLSIPVTTLLLLVTIGRALFDTALFAGIRDYGNRSNRTVEQRVRTYVQHETFLLQQGQQDLVRQVAYLRSEMHALLVRLPEKIEAYGDDREDRGEERAVRRLSACTDVPPPGTATVSPLHPARFRH